MIPPRLIILTLGMTSPSSTPKIRVQGGGGGGGTGTIVNDFGMLQPGIIPSTRENSGQEMPWAFLAKYIAILGSLTL